MSYITISYVCVNLLLTCLNIVLIAIRLNNYISNIWVYIVLLLD